MALNFLIAPPLFALLDGAARSGARLRSMRALDRPGRRSTSRVVAVIAEIYAELGLTALVFVLLNVVALHATWRGWSSTARERTRQYANLSWGVLSGPHPHARRARLARGAPLRRGRRLLPRHRHARRDVQARPGARAHRGAAARHRQVRALRPRHGARRPARRGRLARRSAAIPTSAPSCCATSASTARSPRSSAPTTSASTAAATRAGCSGDEIPAIARIVAVAEVYDTLTAPDTYRTPMNSFEALNELRRVAGIAARPGLRRGARRAARPAAAPTTATPTRPTSTASSTSSGG